MTVRLLDRRRGYSLAEESGRDRPPAISRAVGWLGDRSDGQASEEPAAYLIDEVHLQELPRELVPVPLRDGDREPRDDAEADRSGDTTEVAAHDPANGERDEDRREHVGRELDAHL